MLSHRLTFDSPQFLWLLALLPVLWALSFRSLAGLGRMRRVAALAFRSAVMTLCIVAMAEIQWEKTSEKLTVIYLLDQSQSIPVKQRGAMLEYVVREVAKHRNQAREDRAGVIVFGRDALIEVPPFDDDIQTTGTIESTLELRTDATNLSAALKLAQASFPEDTARRIVLVTDGNENLGDARSIAQTLADNGIGIDVVPVRLSHRAEVAVEKVAIPPDVRRGQPFDATVVVNNFAGADETTAPPVRGKLTVLREIGKTTELLSEQDVELAPGKNVYRFQQKLDQPAVYTYRAKFVPADTADDAMAENNEATAFSHIRGKGRVLMIVDWQAPNHFEYLVGRLRAMNLEVDLQPTDRLFTSLAELQGYDTVILADVPRSGGEAGNDVVSFSDDQIRMLVRNTEQMGCGLVMLGGPASFGAGGWANTELEKAMPVDFQIKNTKIQAVGALVMMMHASEMAEGNHWQKVVGRKSLEMMGPMDYAGCIHWGMGGNEWLWGGADGLVRISGRKNQMLAQVDRMTPGDMPDFDSSMKMALRAFNRVDASVKHMIMISDGDPSPPSPQLLRDCLKANVQISTVAIGTHGPPGSTPLQNIANVTKGKYYVVNDARALPQIYQREVRRIAKPLIKDLDDVRPRLVYRHEMLQGINEPLPPLKRFVMTTVKDNPLVETAIVSPEPADTENATILASWTYGLGRTVALTTDAGQSWAKAWTEWSDYDKFFSQMIRWSMRPLGDQGNFSVATNLKDGKVQVVVTALDKDDEFRNFLNLAGSVITPDLGSEDVKFKQIAAGRYVAEFESTKAGSYFVAINPGGSDAPIFAGVNVPYSAEFRDRETNLGLLTSLVRHAPKEGQAGELIEGELRREGQDGIEKLLKIDTFRHTLPKAVSRQAIWPLILVIAAAVFFADVFVRRVTLSFEWVAPAWSWVRTHVLRQAVEAAPDERLARLRSRKAAATEQIDERRAATRFEPQIDPAAASPSKSLDQVLAENQGAAAPADKPTTPHPGTPLAPGQVEEDSYTARLLKAKQRAKKDL